MAYFTDEADPIHKVTIVAKGQSAGHTAFVKEKDSWHQKRTQLLAQMDTSKYSVVSPRRAFFPVALDLVSRASI